MKYLPGIVDSYMVKCDCHSHMLEIDRLVEDYKDKETGEKSQIKSFEISTWSLGHSRSIMSFKERLRWCWYIMWTGKPWCDMLTISDEQAVELAQFLNKHTK
jgi:hypothetical protein